MKRSVDDATMQVQDKNKSKRQNRNQKLITTIAKHRSSFEGPRVTKKTVDASKDDTEAAQRVNAGFLLSLPTPVDAVSFHTSARTHPILPTPDSLAD